MNGTVCHYDSNGKFGFIEVKGEERTIFFHNSKQRSFYCGLDAQIHCDAGWDREPVKGDKVIILGVTQAKKGPKADEWALEETKEAAEKVLALVPIYRLRHRNGPEKVSRLDTTPTFRTIWEGKDLLDLMNCSKHIRVERDEYSYYYFETLNGESWEHCSDPRPH